MLVIHHDLPTYHKQGTDSRLIQDLNSWLCGGFLKQGYPQSSSMKKNGIIHEINYPFSIQWGTTMTMETSMSLYKIDHQTKPLPSQIVNQQVQLILDSNKDISWTRTNVQFVAYINMVYIIIQIHLIVSHYFPGCPTTFRIVWVQS